MTGQKQSVKRRHVFYVPGYDPMPPRRYRELYRSEAARQAQISGYEIEIAGATGHGERYHWNASSVIDGHKTDSKIEFLLWNDIVSQSMKNSIPQTYWLLLKTLWLYVSTGTLQALFRLRRAPILAALYPAIVLLGQILFAVLLGRLVGQIIGGILGIILGVGLAYSILIFFRRWDKKFFAYYLLFDFAFWAQLRGEMPSVLRPRVKTFADRIVEALDSGADEVLLIGHSSGAHLAVALVAEVARQRPQIPNLSLLTLGQAIPVLSFLPGAWDLRRDLRAVSMRPDITWVDVSAPGDGACFALCDPVAVSGVAPPEGAQFGPKVFSAAFTHTLSQETLRKTRWKFFRRHIQYLYAFDKPKDYDYFQITAGPISLRDRYAERGSSTSMISKPCSPHKSVAPKHG